MKRIIFFILAIPLFLSSCTKDPNSSFTVSTSVAAIGETVFFTNRSFDAERFEWDFGDGFVATSFNASHYYDYDGTYTVSLKAFNNGKMDISLMTVKVIDASIIITVEEYYEPYYLVPDVRVRLYPTVTDWERESNMVAEGFTNSAGVIRFDHLAEQRYYVDVYGPNHDNYTLAEEDAGFIETPVMIAGTVTSWTALVDYYPEGKKSTLNSIDLKIQRKMEASDNSPRKVGFRVK